MVMIYMLSLQWVSDSKNINTGQDHHKNPLDGGVRLNLPEFTWRVSRSIVTDRCEAP